MTKIFIIIALLCSTLAYGQVPKVTVYKNIVGLTIADSITWQDIVGGFYISNGFGGYNFRLDSNMTFHKNDFSCMARFTVDSGSWSIKNHNTVVLKSNKLTLYFDIVKFDNFYFFILPVQRQNFIHDLQATWEKCKNFKGTQIGDRTMTAKDMVGYSLISVYYGRDIADSTGT